MRFPARRLDTPADHRVVAALEAVGAGRSTVQLPTMSASFRADLRMQLVAVAPRLVAEGVRPGTETAARPAAARTATAAPRAAARSARPARARTRPMTVLVAGAAVVVLGLGGVTWLSRDALPGDALYGLKRTAEGVDVSLSGSDLDKGHALLVGAQTRVEEVDQLVSRPQSMALGTGTSAAGGLSDSTVKLVVSTLATADTDTQKGVATIGDDAVAQGTTAGLELVVAWAGGDNGTGGQIGRIQSLVNRIPSTDAAASAQNSLRNIDAAYQRAGDLLAEVQNNVTCAHDRDEFGPVPCAATPSAPASVTPPASGAPTSGATASTPGGASRAPTTGGAPSSAPATPAPTATATATTRTRAASNAPPAVSVGSCGVGVGLPVATVSLGTCTSTP